ncbi:hypothetical protein LCM28_05565 [Salipiger pacificus]|nr:hypothetical protein [Alloyangia pacifica]
MKHTLGNTLALWGVTQGTAADVYALFGDISKALGAYGLEIISADMRDQRCGAARYNILYDGETQFMVCYRATDNSDEATLLEVVEGHFAERGMTVRAKLFSLDRPPTPEEKAAKAERDAKAKEELERMVAKTGMTMEEFTEAVSAQGTKPMH